MVAGAGVIDEPAALGQFVNTSPAKEKILPKAVLILARNLTALAAYTTPHIKVKS
jgi:hypothetical protein